MFIELIIWEISSTLRISGSFLPNFGDSILDIGDDFKYPSNTRNLKKLLSPEIFLACDLGLFFFEELYMNEFTVSGVHSIGDSLILLSKI